MDANKRAVAFASAGLLITVPWMQISRARASNIALTPADIAAVVAVGAAIHAIFLIVS